MTTTEPTELTLLRADVQRHADADTWDDVERILTAWSRARIPAARRVGCERLADGYGWLLHTAPGTTVLSRRESDPQRAVSALWDVYRRERGDLGAEYESEVVRGGSPYPV